MLRWSLRLLATLANANAIGTLGNDMLTVAGASGQLVDKNAGSAKAVDVTGITLGGADAGNYAVDTSTEITPVFATIDKALLTGIGGLAAEGSTQNGVTNVAMLTSNANVTGTLGNDTLTVASATGQLIAMNPGQGNAVNVTGITLGGADAGNYIVDTTTAIAPVIASIIGTPVTGTPGTGTPPSGSTSPGTAPAITTAVPVEVLVTLEDTAQKLEAQTPGALPASEGCFNDAYAPAVNPVEASRPNVAAGSELPIYASVGGPASARLCASTPGAALRPPCIHLP